MDDCRGAMYEDDKERSVFACGSAQVRFSKKTDIRFCHQFETLSVAPTDDGLLGKNGMIFLN